MSSILPEAAWPCQLDSLPVSNWLRLQLGDGCMLDSCLDIRPLSPDFLLSEETTLMAEAQRTTIDTGEVARFSALAAEWWNPNGKFRPLHKFNPVRLVYIRDQIAARFGRDPRVARPFEGLRILA